MILTAVEMTNIIASTCAFVITVMLIIFLVCHTNLKERVFFWFFVIVILNLGLTFNEWIIYLLGGHTGSIINVVIRIFDFFSYAGPLLQVVAAAYYFYELINRKSKVSKKLIRYLQWFCLAAILFTAVAQSNSLFGYFDEQNVYYANEDTSWIYAVLIYSVLMPLLGLVLRYSRTLSKKEFFSLLLYFIVPIPFYIIEILIPGLWLADLGATLTFCIIYVNVQAELKRQMELELMENRIGIMLSQIQPHFLYNSLASIEYLCDIDGAERAASAVQDFSEYLRGNMDSLTQKELITFAQEMQHTNLYLSLEKRRFGDRIETEYDTPVTDFLLPALTLQPIVENAVRHGITKRDEGGTIMVRSFEDKEFWRITVTDNGVGFDVSEKKKDERTHVGIENVRSRLKAMCDGTLEIISVPGVGTTATISIPKKIRGENQ